LSKSPGHVKELQRDQNFKGDGLRNNQPRKTELENATLEKKFPFSKGGWGKEGGQIYTVYETVEGKAPRVFYQNGKLKKGAK